MQYTQEELEARYNSLPEYVRLLISAPETVDKIIQIGDRNGLLLDKIDVLNEIVGNILMGITPPKNFVPELVSQGVPEKIANKVRDDINAEILSNVKISGTDQKADDRTSSVNSIEKVGDFEIIEADIPEERLGDSGTRSDMLSAIENPPPVKMSPAKEPLVDQLLHGSTAIPEEKVSIAPGGSAGSDARDAQGGPDPYREAVE